MNRFRQHALLWVLITAACIPAFTFSGTINTEQDRVSYEVLWAQRILRVSIERAIDTGGTNAPTAVARTQAAIQRDAHPLIVRAILSIPLSSDRTVEEHVQEQPRRLARVYEAARSATAVDSRGTPDLTRAVVSYELNLTEDLTASLFPNHRAQESRRVLGWAPTAPYSGILIYAADELPVFGTNRTSRLQPVVLPDLYYLSEDETRALPLFTSDNLPFATMTGPGLVHYADETDSLSVIDRVGRTPLTIVARGIFGRYPSDLLMSPEDALAILSSESNIELLRQGRVAVILGSDN